MNSKQIDTILRNDEKLIGANYLGVFARNKIPSQAKWQYPCCAVVNNQPDDKEGMHWVCFLKTSQNKGIYFDSYGTPPYNFEEVAEVFEDCIEWEFNDVQLQTMFSSVCGQYTIFALTHLVRGYTLKQIVYLLEDCGDTHTSDALVFSYINNKYSHILSDPKLSIVDLPLALRSIDDAMLF